MKYLYNRGVGNISNRKLLFIPLILLIVGSYLSFNIFSPLILYTLEPSDVTANLLKTQQPEQNVDRLYIPKINANIIIAPIGTDEKTALSMGAVSRSNQNGNPKAGGNYVLVAERFSLQVLPNDTFEKSRFYNFDTLQIADDLFVDYKGTRFVYQIDSRQMKESTDPAIEGSTTKPRLTLYTVEMTGKGTREIITASQVGKVVWTSGIPKVQSIIN